MENQYSDLQRNLMLSLARAAIEKRGVSVADLRAALTTGREEFLNQQRACFVTLQSNQQLRGCIGTLEPSRTLFDDIALNARAAAFSDYRFEPLKDGERIGISISVLTPVKPMLVVDEADLLSRLRPGVDGVVFRSDQHRATFLPAVWEALPDPRAFIQRLKQKAGLSSDYWSSNVEIGVYQVEYFAEPGEQRVNLNPDAKTGNA